MKSNTAANVFLLLFFLIFMALLISFASASTFDELWMGRVARPPSDGVASRFNDKLLARQRYGKVGEILCAHRTEGFDRVLVVTNINNGKSVDCPVRDRGPYWNGRVIDLYPAADKAIGCDGLCRVKVRRKGFD